MCEGLACRTRTSHQVHVSFLWLQRFEAFISEGDRHDKMTRLGDGLVFLPECSRPVLTYHVIHDSYLFNVT